MHCIVVGAGLSGLATAIALRRSNHDVTVLESAPEIQPLGAGINLFPNATRIFKQWGLLADLENISFKIDHANFRSYSDSKILSVANFDHGFTDTYGAPYLCVHRASLAQLLLSAAKSAGAVVRMAAEVADVSLSSNSRQRVILTSKEALFTDVIIGADGERSSLRRLIGQSVQLIDSGDHVFRFTLPSSVLEDDPELAEFGKSTSVNFWGAPGGQAIGYKLREGDRYNMVFTTKHNPEAQAQMMPKPMDVESVLPEFSTWDARLRRLLAQAKSCTRWTLLETELTPQWRCSDSGKVCLIGDAAHSMLPYLGQGAAMAIEDAAAFGEIFATVKTIEQVDQALELFEALRKPRTTAMASRSKSMQGICSLPNETEQAQKDRQLLHDEPGEGCPNFLLDPILSKWMFSYDAINEARAAVEASKQVI